MAIDTRIQRGDERDGEHEVVHVATRESELNRLIEEQALDLMTEGLRLDAERAEFLTDDTEPDDYIRLLDPIVAYEREARRMSAAGPRRRITADDLG